MVDVRSAAAAYLRHQEERRNQEVFNHYVQRQSDSNNDEAVDNTAATIGALSSTSDSEANRYRSRDSDVRTLHIASVGSGMGWASNASASVLAFEAILHENGNYGSGGGRGGSNVHNSSSSSSSSSLV